MYQCELQSCDHANDRFQLGHDAGVDMGLQGFEGLFGKHGISFRLVGCVATTMMTKAGRAGNPVLPVCPDGAQA